MLIQQLGLAIIAVVLLQVVLFTLFSLWRQWISLRVLQRRLAWAQQVAQFEHLTQEKNLQRDELMWNGYRKFEVKEKIHESENKKICSFYLVPHDKKPLPSYFPGQFLTFQMNPTEPGRLENQLVVRCYSLSDRPDLSYYRVTIKQLPPPRGDTEAPPGLISNYFHERIKEGDILDVKAPSGQFYLDTKAQTPVVLIGGGVGLTPMVSMLNDITGSGSSRETWFCYGTIDGTEHMMKDHLKNLARKHKNVHMQIAYSSPKKKDVMGKDYHHKGHIDVALLQSLLPSNNYTFYICGPPPMMSALVPALEEWGVPESDIHYEPFGPATVIRKKTEQPESLPKGAAKKKALQVTFSKSGKTLDWDSSMASLLAFADANEVVINSGCRVGNCNTCLTTIKEGDVEYIRKPDEEPQGGSCLTCISIPKGDLMLDA